MDNAVRRTLTNLLTGYGYNLYEDKNRMRADDILVRERASTALGEAASAVRSLQREYRGSMPPLTRDHPEPPREHLETLKRMQRLEQRLDELEVRVRSMPVPSQDRVWERFRNEHDLLERLLQFDHDLISPCEELRKAVQGLTVESWNTESAAMLESAGKQVDEAARSRAEFMQLPA